MVTIKHKKKQRGKLINSLYFSGFKFITSTQRYLCAIIATVQDICNVVVVIDFQAIILFLVAHTSAMYLLLAKEMIALSKYTEKDGGYTIVKEKLPSLIHRHILLLKMVTNLKLLYSNPLGVNFGLNAVFICLFSYLPFKQWGAYIPMLFYFFIIFFLYCYLCQKLVNATEIFENAVYCCGWENFQLKEMKSVYIIVKLAQKPVRLLAADMIVVNMYTFASTLQFIFKFVTVLKT